MKAELKNMSRKELEKLKSDIDKVLSKISEKEMKEARAAAEKAVAAFGVTLNDVVGAPAQKKRGPKPKTGPKVKSPARYKNPANADQTWTGKGRQPEWFKAEIAKGTDPSALAV